MTDRKMVDWKYADTNDGGAYTNILFTKVESSHNNVRTNTMIGECMWLPQIGKSFLIYSCGGSLVGDGDRVIHTTQVKEIKLVDDYTIEFKTQNSTYRLNKYVSQD
jgi:hypothetical protein